MFKEVPGGRRSTLPPPAMGLDRQSARKSYPIDWETCDAVSCNGIIIPGQRQCVAHALKSAFYDWLRKRKPTKSLDLRGVPLSSELLDEILKAYRDIDGWIKINELLLQSATFERSVSISHLSIGKQFDIANARFSGGLRLDHVKVKGNFEARQAIFGERLQIADAELAGANDFSLCKTSYAVLFARVSGNKFIFNNAEFNGSVALFAGFNFNTAWFDQTDFNCSANFEITQNRGQFFFHGTKFHQNFSMNDVSIDQASFYETLFEGGSHFSGVAASSIRFTRVSFPDLASMGPLMVLGRAVFDQCIFKRRVELTILSSEIDFTGSDFQQGATIAGKYAKASFEAVTFGGESTIMSADRVSWMSFGLRIEARENSFDERKLASKCKDARFKIASFRGVDVSPLLLVNVSLEPCLFAGSYNLDRLRIESPKPFADTPPGFRIGSGWPPVWRWTRRQCLAEEYQWRSTLSNSFRMRPEVKPPSFMSSERRRENDILDAERLAAVYRSLRKSLEDGKNEPGAADFYYGEMEARRRSIATPRVERMIIWFYWLISGYSLRGTRSFMCLIISVFVLSWFMLQYGFFAAGRMDYFKSLVYTASATLSISYDQIALTQWGEVLRIIVRILGPLFLGLTVLSIRNRIKR